MSENNYKKPVKLPVKSPVKSGDQPQIVTFGCRLNLYESEIMKIHASDAGMENAIIFNTCAVTKEAERQARQQIRKARRENPDAKIIVTGCSAQIHPDMYSQMPEIDKIIGNDMKMKAQTWHDMPMDRVIVNDIMAVQEVAGHLVADDVRDMADVRARSFLQVQQGCDHRCTFCIIPYGRGNSRSVPMGVIVDHARQLVQQGVNEIVLTGVDMTSYGADLPGKPSLGQMMRRLLAMVPDLPRLRLSSVDPVEIDDDLWGLIADEPRLMPHLHISMQAGDDMVLKRMKRRHLRDDIYQVCDKARRLRPDIVFGADVIAGFPTESDAMFENTYYAIKDNQISHLHVFPYSEREGTPAAKMPQVDKSIRKERAAKLRDLGDNIMQDLLSSHIGRQAQIIMEKNNIGRSAHFLEIDLAGDDSQYPAGSLQNVKVTALKNGRLFGQIIS